MRAPEQGWAFLVARLALLAGTAVFLTVSALGASAGSRADEGVPRVREVREDSPQREQQMRELLDRAQEEPEPSGNRTPEEPEQGDVDREDADQGDTEDPDREDAEQEGQEDPEQEGPGEDR